MIDLLASSSLWALFRIAKLLYCIVIHGLLVFVISPFFLYLAELVLDFGRPAIYTPTFCFSPLCSSNSTPLSLSLPFLLYDFFRSLSLSPTLVLILQYLASFSARTF